MTAVPTFVHLLRERARSSPDRLAYVFLQNGEDESARLTVGELDARARAIGAALQERGGAGERALLLYPPGLDFVAAFFGCLYAGVIAVPSYPPAPSRPGRGQPRLKSIVEDCAPRFVLTTESLAPRVAALDADLPGLAAAEVLVTDLLPEDLAETWQEPEIGPETLAFLQYTSGSTSDPKGVMVSHGNLAHNEEVIREACRHDEQSTFVSWLPIYHDMGLIGGLLQPLWVGAACVLMAPVAFLQRPVRWLRAIAKWRAHTSGAPDFAYDLCVRKITPEQREGLDLSSWRVAFDGAEPVRAATVEAFLEAFGPVGFQRDALFPCYGLAEATLIVSGRRRPESPVIRTFQGLEEHRVQAAEEGARLVGCGPAGLGLEIAIADPETLEEKEPDGVGEIWVAGPSVARGYWGRPDLSEATFGARLAGRPGRTFLRTGDLGFLSGGELFVTGRIKDLIIVRGRNHYPQDLEATAAASHPALRAGAGAAFSVEATGGESAAIVQEIDPRRTREGEEALGAVRQALAEEHEIPVSAVVLVKTGMIPKTTSGKVQRQLTRQLFLEGRLEPVIEWRAELIEPPVSAIQEPADDLLAWLQARVAAKLGLRASDVDPKEPLARHGIDSLSAVELTHEIETTLGLDLPLATLLEAPSLLELVASFPPLPARAGGEAGEGGQGGEGRAGELTPSERALWFLHQLEPASPAYHIAGAARILSGLDDEALRQAFQAQVDRHPALRTTFELRDGEPVKRVQETAEVDFRVEEGGQAEIEAEIFRPFDLQNGPLLRVRVFHRPDGERTLLLVIHHLIADFWSLAVMVRTLTPSPSPTRPPYPPGEGSSGFRIDEARIGFWQDQLAGYPFALEIPTDRPRPARPGHRAAAVPFVLDRETSDRLRSTTRERGTTLFAGLLAVFQVLLHRAAGQERLLVGAPTSGRSRAAMAGEVGYFVNTVVLPSSVEDDPTFETLLDRARRSVLDAFAREVPFPALVERLQPERDPGRTPLFQAAFALQKAPRREEEALAAFSLNVPGFRLDLGGLALESLALPVLPGQFDLTLVAAEMDGEMRASLFYDLDLFEEGTAVRMTEWLRNLATGLVAEPGRRAGEVASWSEAERRQVIEEWGGAEVPPLRPLIPERVAARAAETPEAEALRQGERSVTYAELARRAHGLAWKLRSLGVGPEVRVSVFAERRPETVMGLLAVLEAGGAYVPLEPVFPPERVARLVADAGARVLLTERPLAARLPTLPAELIFLDDPWEERNEPPPEKVSPRNLAYVIYTSGSTGRPKGAEISHESLRAFVERHEERFGIGPGDTVAHISGQGFDASILELWVPLANGARVRMPEEDEIRSSPPLLLDWLISADITHVFMTTALYEALLQLGPALRRPSRLRHLLTGGERLRLRPPADLPFEVWTNYGPTETTVLATSGRIPSEDPVGRLPSIGQPIRGTRVVFLDRLFRPVPLGAPGELCLGGPGLGRGYLERPDQTAEKFIPDPFGPPGARLYRSGDLGRWRPDGELEFLRRIDDQVKVRGFRVEPGEIERTLAQHPGVREAVVLPVDDPAIGKRLVAFITPVGEPMGEDIPSSRELREHLSATLPPYMVPSAFVALDALPLTINTKVDRRALEARAALAAPEGEAVAPRDAIEETLAELWAAELGRERVGIHDDFFALGGHSLLGARLVARIRETFGADLSLRRLFETPTVAGLAEALRTSESAVPLRPVPRDRSLRPSIAQESLWFLDRLEPGMPTYNVPMEIRWGGELSVPALRAALSTIVERHEALRTRFPEVEGSPVLEIGNLDREAGLLDLSGLPSALRDAEADRISEEEARRPFDLERGPLARAVLIRLSEAEHRFLWTTHHIISDGASLGVWLEELAAFYRAAVEGRPAALPDLVVQPADVAARERVALESGVLEPQLAFWESLLAGAPVLELPSDRSRPVTPTSRGVLRTLELSEGLGAAVTALARQERATPFMALLASFTAFLSRIADQDDLVLGTPVSRRGRAELEPLVGFLVDTVAVRVSTAGEPVFRDLVGRTRRATLDAFRHADVPFEAVVERVRPERGLGRNPVFPVLFSVPPPLPTRIELPGAVLEPRGIATGTAKFDLSLFVRDEKGKLIADLEAALDLFESATADRLLRGWAVLLEAAVAAPERPVTDLPLLDDAERVQLLTEWNETGPVQPVEDRLDSLFRAQASRTPDALALIAGEERLTYRELAERVSRMADHLRQLGVGPETVVGVSLPRTAELIVALLGVLEAGAAYLPLDPAYPEERRRFLVEDAGAEVVVEASTTQPSPPDPLSRHPAPPPRERGRERELAYLIYTSGSTGRPKGVAIEHASAVRLVAWAAATYTREELAGVLASTSINFDLSVFEIFVPLSTGGTVILAEDALSLPSLPAREEVTLVNTVPSALAALLELGPLPASVRTVNVAGEPLRRSLAERFHADGPRKLWNLYGPSEDTTYSTGALIADEEPPIGRPVAGARAYVVDRGLGLLPRGLPGELCLGGGGLARGYWRRPDLTAERFVPDPLGGEPGARLYRTGDRVRWRADGQLEFLGRLDHQVKIRGFRVEPGEIEATLLRHPHVGAAAVLALPGPGGHLQLAAFVAPGPLESTELREHLASRLPAAFVPASFTVLDALPLNPNGKVDRAALARLGAAPVETTQSMAPRDPVEELLAGIWAELLGVERVGIHDDFFALGGHSLLATRIVARVRSVLGVELPVRSLFETPTVAGLAVKIRGADASTQAPPLVPLPRGNDFPLSFAQERLWFLHRLDPEAATYNMAGALRLSGDLDAAALEQTLREIARRHEALRTTFPAVGGVPVQRIAPEPDFILSTIDVAGSPDEAAVAEGSRPFDLESGPVLRALLIRRGPAEHLLAVTLPHIVADGWSLGILMREVGELYPVFAAGGTPEASAPPVQVADFAVWQREWLQGEPLRSLLGWWRGQLAGSEPGAGVPSDRPRPSGSLGRGGVTRFRLPADLVANLEALGRQRGATLFMTLLAGWKAVLHRWSGTGDLCVGAPTANRDRVEIEGVIGCFVNTLALRTVLDPAAGFAGLLDRVRATTLGAYDHQELPFEKLVEELRPDRTLAPNPLFQTLFALQNAPRPRLELPGLDLELVPVDLGAPKLDLALTVEREGAELAATLEFAAALFDPATAERLARHWEILLAGAAADPERPLGRLPLLTPEESRQILGDWIPPRLAIPRSPFLHERFAESARRKPDAPAVRFEDQEVSYGELERRSNRLAWHLISLGVRPGDRVGLGLERSIQAVEGILGILKAGAAWLPLDPAQPPERLAAMTRDAGAAALLTTGRLAAALGPLASALPQGAPLVLLDDHASSIAACPDESPGLDLPEKALAYVLYTSGSTGMPKGVCCLHIGLANLIDEMERLRPLPPGTVCSQWASLSFDGSVLEVFTPCTAGGCLDIVPDHVRTDGRALVAWMAERGIGRAFVPPALIADFAAGFVETPAPLLRLEVAGEAVPLAPLATIASRRPEVCILDCYGPTEAAVAVSAWPLPADPPREGFALIGRPLHNVRIYVLSPEGEPAPVGVPGELFLAGIGVAQGYLGRPDLNAERFLPDPFSIEPGERMYRSGDLGRWTPTGDLAFLGRVDDQVKIRGIRIEPGEVAAVLRQIPGVREAAVAVRSGPRNEPALVAWVVSDPGAPVPSREALRVRLPEAMIPSAFVALDALPLTRHGKVDRAALPDPVWERAAGERVPPRTPVEERLAELWADLLAVEPERVGVRDSFFDLGGHSLKAGQLVLRVRDLFGIELPVREIFESPTIEALAVAIGRKLPERTAPRIRRRERAPGAGVPLSFGQQQLWFLQQMDPGTPVYNLPAAIRCEGRLRIGVLARCLAEIERRHEVLRTAFTVAGGELVQIPRPFEADPAAPRLPVLDLSGLPGETRDAAADVLALEEARRPFDLTAGRLVRAVLLRLDPERHLLLLTQHHIGSDVWSAGLLVRELGELYRAFAEGRPSPLPEPEVQFGDFVEWQREHYQGETLEKLLAWWRERLGDRPSGFELPADRPRPAVQTYRGAAERIDFDPGAVEALRPLASAEGTTLFTVLLTAFGTVLARWAGREDVVVGTAAASRPDTAVESLLGLFLDTLVLRSDLGGDPAFREALRRVRETALGAFGHPLPFRLLIEGLQPERDLSRSPLFQIFFSLQTVGLPALELPEVTLRPQEIQTGTTQFDLAVYLTDAPGGLTGWLEYNADLYEAGTIRRLARSFARLAAAAASGPDRRLSDLPLLDTADELRLDEWSRARPEVLSASACLHHLFSDQVARTPDAIAAVHRGRRWTWSELDARSSAVSELLRDQGVRPGDRVGLCAERSLPMLAGLLGILKAGAAYVPLDPSYPESRLTMMLEDAGTAALVVYGDRARRLAQGQERVLDLERSAVDDGRSQGVSVPPEAPAYVIYTSGSTGTPKGVIVTHHNVAGFFAAMDEVLEAGRPDDRPGVWLAVTSISFDISVLELLWTLTRGYRVVLQDEVTTGTESEDDFSIPAQIAREGVTHLQCTPSLAGMLAADPDTLRSLAPLRALLLGGEALPAPLAATLKGVLREGSLLDVYGPTEATIWSLSQRIEEVGERVPIGRPLANNTVRLLDRRLGQVPPGMPGEVWLGGDGVAAGYWRRPDLTAERFLPDPFAAAPGARMYRTGDLARFRPDSSEAGVLDFLGRVDHQVKVRGHRIELGEVEAALRAHPDVREATVTVREEGAGDRRLVGYVVPAGGAGAELQVLSASELRRWLAERIPDPWIPADFVMMEALPLTGSGKIDRRALPAPATDRPALDAEYVAPRNSAEQSIAEIWREVLGRERVGVHDNFFEVGGSSLLLVRIQARLREVLGREVTMVQLFRNPTIQSLARFFESVERETRAVADAEDRARVRAGAVQKAATIDRQKQFLEEMRRRKDAGRRRP